MMKWVLILPLGLGLSVGMALPVQADKGSNRWTLVEKNAQIPPLSAGHSGLVFLALPSVCEYEKSERKCGVRGNGQCI